jgi:cobalt ECF transporter T component CbiQ
MGNKIPSYLLNADKHYQNKPELKRARLSFLDRSIRNSAKAVKSIYVQAENSTKKTYIYSINPRIKVVALIYFAVIISIANNLTAQLLTTVFIMLLYLFSKLNIFQLYKKIFFLSFIFAFLVVLPASLNIISHGKIIYKLISFDSSHHFWIYNIPQVIGITSEGCHVVALIFLRLFNSISFAMLIVFTTSFPHFIKSFKILGVPDTFLMIISLAYKYIFILSKTIEEIYFALKSRLISHIKNKKLRTFIANRIFFIFRKSRTNYELTYFAMVSRGYNGKIVLHSQNKISIKEIISLVLIIVFGICIILI